MIQAVTPPEFAQKNGRIAEYSLLGIVGLVKHFR
jgi:hypothetical protein